MNRRLILSLIALLPFGGVIATPMDDAQQVLHKGIDEVLALADRAPTMEALIERLTPVLEKHISFSVMTRRAIGPGWRQFSSEEQAKAAALFKTLVIRSYSNSFTIGEKPVIKYQSATEVAPGRVDISSTTGYQGTRYKVIYRLEQSENWRATDVVIEGVSMVANYRSQLDPVFKKGGVAAVLKSLEQSVARPQ